MCLQVAHSQTSLGIMQQGSVMVPHYHSWTPTSGRTTSPHSTLRMTSPICLWSSLMLVSVASAALQYALSPAPQYCCFPLHHLGCTPYLIPSHLAHGGGAERQFNLVAFMNTVYRPASHVVVLRHPTSASTQDKLTETMWLCADQIGEVHFRTQHPGKRSNASCRIP